MSTTPPPGPWGEQPPPPPGTGYPAPPPGSWQAPGTYPPPPPASWSSPQGYPPTGGMWAGQGSVGGTLAGWWYRVGATVIDGVLLGVLGAILQAILGRVGGETIEVIVGVVYYVVLLGQRGQTVGCMALGVKVVDQRAGGPIGYPRAFLRWLVEGLLFVVLFIPWVVDILWPLWDTHNQTLHDKAAGSVLIRTS